MPAQPSIPRIAFLSPGAFGEPGGDSSKPLPAIERMLELEANGKLVLASNILPDVLPDIPPELAGSCSALVCRPTWGGKVTDDLVERIRLPDRDFVVATLSAGDSHITTTRDDITVIKARAGNASQTAEMTVFLAICLLRRIAFSLANMGFGVYMRPVSADTRSLKNLTWTIMGPGNIGTGVLSLASALGVKELRAYHPDMSKDKISEIRERNPTVPSGVVWTSSIQDAVVGADVITLHMPLNETTRHIIDARVLKCVSPSAVLVNMARHDLVDEAALITSLEGSEIAGYAADVLSKDSERYGANPRSPHAPIWGRSCWGFVSGIGCCTYPLGVFHDEALADAFHEPPPGGVTNLVLTPHLGGSTWDAECQVSSEVIADLLDQLDIEVRDD